MRVAVPNEVVRKCVDLYACVCVCVCHRELESWVHDMQTLIGAVEVARDVASAEATLQRHRERKVATCMNITTATTNQQHITTQFNKNP